MEINKDDWGPGCEPRWWITGQMRQVRRDGQLVLQQRYGLQGYGQPAIRYEWRDVPIVDE